MLIRFKMIKAAAIKIMKVILAFSLIPRILRPAIIQIMASTRLKLRPGKDWKNEVALATALTAEIQAVSM